MRSGRDRQWSSDGTTDSSDGVRASRSGNRQGDGEPRAIGLATRTTEAHREARIPATGGRLPTERAAIRSRQQTGTPVRQPTATTTPGASLGRQRRRWWERRRRRRVETSARRPAAGRAAGEPAAAGHPVTTAAMLVEARPPPRPTTVPVSGDRKAKGTEGSRPSGRFRRRPGQPAEPSSAEGPDVVRLEAERVQRTRPVERGSADRRAGRVAGQQGRGPAGVADQPGRGPVGREGPQ